MPAIPAPPAATSTAAAVAAAPDAVSPPRERTKPGTDARDLVKRLVAEAVSPAAAPAAPTDAAARRESDSGADTATVPFVRASIGAPITVAETPAATVSVSDTVTVAASADTARLVASPTVTIQAAPPVDVAPGVATPIASASGIAASIGVAPGVATPIASASGIAASIGVAPGVAMPVAPGAPLAATAAPVATEDEPSDGVIRAMIATIDTAKLARQRQERPAPEHEGPAVTETTGEIASPQPRAVAPGEVMNNDQASIMIDQPSMLVSDLAAVHAAAAKAIAPAAPPPRDAASASRELVVAEVRKDAAVAFTDVEEAFFKKAETGPVRTTKVESFDDLDEGYEPPKFWDRVFGRKKPPPPR